MTNDVMAKYSNIIAVIFCYIVKDDKVLLIKRNNPPILNQYTVVGGKKERRENIVDACIREVYEETNLVISNPRLVGIINNFIETSNYETITFYFVASKFSGQLKSSEEGEVEWCNIEQSYKKDGVSEFYIKISPFIFDNKGLFLGDILMDKEGIIKHININSYYGRTFI